MVFVHFVQKYGKFFSVVTAAQNDIWKLIF